MSSDWYESFAQLAANEVEGVDYRIRAETRASQVLIMAPHGGHIEPTTSRIAIAIARDDLSLYLFEGLRPGRGHGELHITSRKFDEARAVALAGRSDRIVTVHGRNARGDPDAVWLGGLDMLCREAIRHALEQAGFPARNPGREFEALHPMNICNRSRTGMGTQMELPRRLRDQLARDEGMMAGFAAAIRAAVMGPPASPAR